MTVEEVKNKLNKYVGKRVVIKYNLGRNKVENYKVIIKELYNNVFLVEMDDSIKQIKSFSYSDVITKTIHIDY